MRIGIESRHRLVQNPDFRLVYKRADYVEFLLHSVRIGGNLLFYGIRKRKKLAIFVESLLSLRTRHLKNVANEVYVLNAGQSLVQHVVVADVSDMLFGF